MEFCRVLTNCYHFKMFHVKHFGFPFLFLNICKIHYMILCFYTLMFHVKHFYVFTYSFSNHNHAFITTFFLYKKTHILFYSWTFHSYFGIRGISLNCNNCFLLSNSRQVYEHLILFLQHYFVLQTPQPESYLPHLSF